MAIPYAYCEKCGKPLRVKLGENTHNYQSHSAWLALDLCECHGDEKVSPRQSRETRLLKKRGQGQSKKRELTKRRKRPRREQ